MDVEILITKDRTVEWTKTKDMEPHKPIKFDLATVKYGEGKRDSSCVLKYDLEYNPKTARNEGAYRKVARQALQEAVKLDGIGGKCMLDTWVSCFVALVPDKTEKAARTALTRKDGGEIIKMIEAGEVEQDGKLYIPIVDQNQLTKGMFNGMV